MVKRCKVVLILTMIAVTFYLLASCGRLSSVQAAEGLREDTAQLDFVKTDTIRIFEGERVLVENYIVKKGDYVWKILQKRGHGSNSQLRYWADALQELNPKMEDINKIYEGQHLLVPLGFLKDVEEEKATPSHLGTETYTVRAGESVVSILRKRFNLPDSLIFDEALNLVKKYNPEVEDLNRIRVGQRLIIPLHEVAKTEEEVNLEKVVELRPTVAPTAEWTDPQKQEPVGEEKLTEDSLEGPTELVVDTRLPRRNGVGAPVRREGGDTFLKTRIASTLSPGEQRVRLLADAFMALTIAMGGRSQNSGQHYLPLKEEGQITLKAQSFPLLEFPTGERIFLDLGDRLSSSLEEAISTTWDSRYTVVNVREKDNFRTVWQGIMDRLINTDQWSERGPMIIRKPLEISILGDWILSLSTPQPRGPKVFVINLLVNSKERTDSALQAYLDNLGVRVLDIQLRGQLERARIIAPLDERAFAHPPTSLVTNPATPQEAAVAYLDLLGLSYESEANVPLDSSKQGEVTISVRAGLYFSWKGHSHLVDFGRLSTPILRLLKESGLRVLLVDPSWTATEVFGAMTTHLGLTAESSYSFFVSERDSSRNIRLTIEGDFIREGERSYLITPTHVPNSLADFLDRKEVLSLSYGPTRAGLSIR
jgi:hypothetical protein